MAKDGNERYRIEVSSPLLRPGLTITTEVSAAYVIEATLALIEKVREINGRKPEPRIVPRETSVNAHDPDEDNSHS